MLIGRAMICSLLGLLLRDASLSLSDNVVIWGSATYTAHRIKVAAHCYC
jgi:hypothetical protein